MSRSGSTIATGLFAGLSRVSATKFSFLLGIPITFGAVAKVLLSDSAVSQLSHNPSIFMIGVLSALISGLFAIKFLIRYLSRHTLAIFAYYRIGLGVVVLILCLF